MAERYCQGKAEVLGEESVPVQYFPPQIPHGFAAVCTRSLSVHSWAIDCMGLRTVLSDHKCVMQ